MKKELSCICPSFEGFLDAVEKVKILLDKVTGLLKNEGIPYAIIGGNAVAAWVASVDESAVRTTKDVDLLINARDIEKITRLFEENGFVREDLKSIIIFMDTQERNRRTGVHIVIASRKVRPSYLHPAPDLSDVEKSKEGFLILNLFSLVKMKLTSFRDKDRVHLGDMVSVGLITPEIRERLPEDLSAKLEIIVKEYSSFDND